MVDHVEFAHPRLIDDFLAGWRNTGFRDLDGLSGVTIAILITFPSESKPLLSIYTSHHKMDQLMDFN